MKTVIGQVTTMMLILAAASNAPAQVETRILEEIVVTAAYREQGLMEVPVSVATVTGAQMTEAALQKAEDVQFLVPSFTLTETGISTNAFIRGIGSGINQAFEQSVGTYIDGVYLGRAQQFRSPFLDIERIEVLRGPQSILFGKNSVAGALNITTAIPTYEPEGFLMASQEFSDDEFIAEAVLSGPVSERVRARVAARFRDLSGHMYNLQLRRDEPQRNDWTLRATLDVDVTRNLTATLKVERSRFDVLGRHIEVINEQPAAGGPFAGLTYNQILSVVFGQGLGKANVVKDEVRTSNGDFSFNDMDTYALMLDWKIGDLDFKSTSAYTAFESDEACDCDFTSADLFSAGIQEDYVQFSQELRLSSPLRDTWDYIVGLYLQSSDHDFADQIIVEPNSVLVSAIDAQSPGVGTLVAGTQASRRARVDAHVASAFAQFNWHLGKQVTLQLGGRLTSDRRDGYRDVTIRQSNGSPLPAEQATAPIVYASAFGFASTNLSTLGPTGAFLVSQLGELPVTGSRDKTRFSPELKFVWTPSDVTMLYASWANGFKSGSFDFRANNRNFYADMAESFEFDDEKADSFELGGKFVLAGGAFELNTALFFTRFENLQISIFDGIFGFNVGNAASAEVQGLELDWRWAATDYLTVRGGVAYTDFEFTDFRNGQCYFGRLPDVDLDGNGIPELCDYTGSSNQLVSDIQGNVSLELRYPFGQNMQFRTLLDAFYTSKYDASATFDPALVQNAYALLNARVGIGPESGAWEIAVLGKNLGDRKALSFGGDTPLAGSTFGAKSNYAFYRTGRTVSLQASTRF